MKRYVYAMSLEKKRAEKQLLAYASILMEHIIKLLVYSDIRPNDVKGWIHTLANWISRADSLTIKPNSSKVSEEFLMSTLFSCMGDEIGDYERELYTFLAENRSGRYNAQGSESYPEFEVTAQLAEDLMNFSLDVAEATIPMLVDKEDHSISEYEEALTSVYNSLVD